MTILRKLERNEPDIFLPWQWGLKEWAAAGLCWLVFYAATYPIVTEHMRLTRYPAMIHRSVEVIYFPISATLNYLAGPPAE